LSFIPIILQDAKIIAEDAAEIKTVDIDIEGISS
jgi:hypothetical protein